MCHGVGAPFCQGFYSECLRIPPIEDRKVSDRYQTLTADELAMGLLVYIPTR